MDVTLDVDTAHNHLFISKDLRRVRCAYLEQKRRVCPERFSCSLCVLGTPRLTSGRHYWEVDVGTSAEWNLGVCKESVSQQEKVVLSSELGFWTLSCRQKDTFLASTEQVTELMVSPRLHRVGVFLDVEMGTISFYHVGDGSHIFTFPPISAAEPLRPFFAPGSPVMDGGSFLMLCPGLMPSVASAAGQGPGALSTEHEQTRPACAQPPRPAPVLVPQSPEKHGRVPESQTQIIRNLHCPCSILL